ncbi:8-amino-7-oxononanoate synthase [Parabacteroides sp. 52]|uniref:aminotransferase class I/II-fold pyridoxal phosphate-dependent enzyme n=1 Tax=unclassified Parabacteroides TaxID=2649774 RepID=UPI0013D5C5BB|nr:MULTISPECIES: 8-amino-7-oxononanoate synthase [unclassified Parabacteroides]MDH6534002.1 8-amino-7-oxononanoate synthase [Parabacteroides sp. PM5-20]NDV54743.1 8-amino-7-oxononanoate synthase [Parabacteroides sp. 52]
MQQKLNELEEKGLLRELKPLLQKGVFLTYKDREYLNLSSNDYLGISAHPELQQEFLNTLDGNEFILGALSSRLLTGNSPCTEALEHYLQTLYGKECLLYNSGYHANVGILPAITEKGDLILADKLIHASIIDGVKLCACELKRYKHNDYEHLEHLLKNNSEKYNTIYIVTESIFSMDGDTADLDKLIFLKKKYNAKLYIDEAHAFGVVGNKGLGCVYNKGFIQDVEYTVCTLGKAAASEGAFVVCGEEIKKWLINKSRTLIFTTATPPINILWTHFIIEKITAMQQEREHLNRIATYFRTKLEGFDVLGNTHIIPLVIGENKSCSQWAEKLQSRGIWAMPVRYPSVPAGSARIRFSLTAAMSVEQINNVYDSLLA